MMKRPFDHTNAFFQHAETSSAKAAAGPAARHGEHTAILENENIAALPDYLKQFIVDQNYSAYTPVDHAVWRYVLRQNHDFLREYAHWIYFEGLDKTGLEIERIPRIEEMNQILEKIGWAAVSVNGFIPPAAFMGFQAHRVLVIASDMRQIHHIDYTPSPDIIHEAAGHAPVIADPEYARYLRLFGEIGSKAISSKQDFELYEAIRTLSILKETPGASQTKIDEAERDVHDKQANLGDPSEMAQLSRLHWWTVEFGLIGDTENFKIYGAGLLSSIGESFRCMSPRVKKLSYGPEAVDYPFDITTEQPHLFVTPSFAYLIEVLENFAAGMAYRIGGIDGLEKAIECENVCTATYSSGLQVSGIMSRYETDERGQLAYFWTTGPTGLAYDNHQLDGHDKEYHRDGFGSPVGKLIGGLDIESFDDKTLAEYGIIPGHPVDLEFESGVRVTGTLDGIIRHEGKILLLTFSDCTVTYLDVILFDPSWGLYDMAVGAAITSVCSGAADKDAYEQPSIVSQTRTITVDYTPKQQKLHGLYQQVRDYREGKTIEDVIPAVWRILRTDYPEDWLLPLEIVELLATSQAHPEIDEQVRTFLHFTADESPHLNKLIHDGLRLADA